MRFSGDGDGGGGGDGFSDDDEEEKEEGARERRRKRRSKRKKHTIMRFGIFFSRIKIGTNKHLTTPSVEYSRDTIHVQVVRATIMSANNNILHTGVHVP